MPEAPEDLLNMAAEHRRQGRFLLAERAYREIAKLDRSSADILVGLGAAALARGAYDVALQACQGATAVGPSCFEAWLRLGDCHRECGRWHDAETAYRQALSIEPMSALGLTRLGFVLERTVADGSALEQHELALRADPSCEEARTNRDNALWSREAVGGDPADLATRIVATGRAVAGEGCRSVARSYFEQAVALDGGNVDAHDALGEIAQGLRQHTTAMDCYRRALTLDPARGATYYRLGCVLQSLDRLPEAACAFREALKLQNETYARATANVADDSHAAQVTPPAVDYRTVILGGHRFPAVAVVPEGGGPRPFWTVIIPVYNRTSYLLECLFTVLAEWRGPEDMEILVLDNASTQPIAPLVHALGRGVVRCYRNPENIGARRNFNLGVALSRGRWIHLIPDDEYVAPGFYGRLRKSLEACDPSVGAAFARYRNINENDEIIFCQDHPGLERGVNASWLSRIGGANLLNPGAAIIRRETYERLGVYDPENLTTPDWELYKRVASFYDWWFEPDAISYYRQHTGSMSSEIKLAGTQAYYYRLGIEISEGYLPADMRAEITRRARWNYFQRCLHEARIPLKAGRIDAAIRVVQEALRIDSSPRAVALLFKFMNQQEMAPLQAALAQLVMSASIGQKDVKDLVLAYP